MYEVVLTDHAASEVQAMHDWWAEHRSAEQAQRWYLGFFEAMISLEQNPDRCPLASENERFALELRQLHFGLGSSPSHRAIFVIKERQVVILRIRHLAQREITSIGG